MNPKIKKKMLEDVKRYVTGTVEMFPSEILMMEGMSKRNTIVTCFQKKGTFRVLVSTYYPKNKGIVHVNHVLLKDSDVLRELYTDGYEI